MNFLKDYVVEFYRCDFELSALFETEKLLAKIDYKLSEAEILAEGPIDKHVLGYVYLQKNNNKKDNFRIIDKHLVPTNIIQKFITNAAKSKALEHIKHKFISKLQWYMEVRNWLYRAYLFINEKSN